MDLEALGRRISRNTRVIVMTNFAAEPYRKAALAAGAEVFLDKSAEFDRVRDILSEIRHGAEDDSEEAPDTETDAAPPPRFAPDMRMQKEVGPGYLAELGILPEVEAPTGVPTPSPRERLPAPLEAVEAVTAVPADEAETAPKSEPPAADLPPQE